MTRVFILRHDDRDEDTNIVGVFSTMDKAEARKQEILNRRAEYSRICSLHAEVERQVNGDNPYDVVLPPKPAFPNSIVEKELEDIRSQDKLPRQEVDRRLKAARRLAEQTHIENCKPWKVECDRLRAEYAEKRRLLSNETFRRLEAEHGITKGQYTKTYNHNDGYGPLSIEEHTVDGE